MLNKKYNIIGVMSGTSLDGVDIIYVTFSHEYKWKYEIQEFETINYTKYWRDKLKNLVALSNEELKKTDTEYTLYLAKTINDFIASYQIKDIDAVCSHGHTALHQPKKKLTYQIGNQQQIASLLNQTVVCDFRNQDVQLGGQGAPLVPIGDKLLFHEYDYCLNLGGFANVSTEYNSERIAYDICPVNIVLNKYAKKMDIEFDDKGQIASTGKINNSLLHKLNALEYYKLKHPKSLGLEWVNYVIFPLIDSFKLSINDALRTFVEHIAIQISNELNKKNKALVLITGGGAYNQFLIDRIELQTTNEIVVPAKPIVEYKEAIIFGFLGVLRLRNEVNCLQSVTGAKQDHSSGNIFMP